MSDDVNKSIQQGTNGTSDSGNDSVIIPPPKVLQHSIDLSGVNNPESSLSGSKEK